MCRMALSGGQAASTEPSWKIIFGHARLRFHNAVHAFDENLQILFLRPQHLIRKNRIRCFKNAAEEMIEEKFRDAVAQAAG